MKRTSEHIVAIVRLGGDKTIFNVMTIKRQVSTSDHENRAQGTPFILERAHHKLRGSATEFGSGQWTIDTTIHIKRQFGLRDGLTTGFLDILRMGLQTMQTLTQLSDVLGVCVLFNLLITWVAREGSVHAHGQGKEGSRKPTKRQVCC